MEKLTKLNNIKIPTKSIVVGNLYYYWGYTDIYLTRVIKVNREIIKGRVYVRVYIKTLTFLYKRSSPIVSKSYRLKRTNNRLSFVFKFPEWFILTPKLSKNEN